VNSLLYSVENFSFSCHFRGCRRVFC